MSIVVSDELLNKITSVLKENGINDSKRNKIIQGVKSHIENNLNPEKKTKGKTKLVNDDLPEFHELNNLERFSSKDEFSKFNIEYLKGALNHFSLKKNGKKNELITRLWDYISATDCMMFFNKNDNSKIKNNELKDHFGQGLKYRGLNLYEFYYKKVSPALLLNLNTIISADSSIPSGNLVEQYIGYNNKDDVFISVWLNNNSSYKEFRLYKISITKKSSKSLQMDILDTDVLFKDDTGSDDICFHSNVFDLINNENLVHIYS